MRNPDWHTDTLRQIDDITSSLDKRIAKRFRVDLLKRIATRLERYSAEGCAECDSLRGKVDRLVLLYEQAAQGHTIDHKEHKALFQELIRHLRSTHKLIEDGTNQSMWMSIGLVLGVTLQRTMLGAASIGIGLCLGIAIGSSMDASAKKAGRML